jgi:hypothetical protein
MGTAGSAGPATDAVAGDAKGETRESRGTGTEKHATREREKEDRSQKLTSQKAKGEAGERDPYGERLKPASTHEIQQSTDFYDLRLAAAVAVAHMFNAHSLQSGRGMRTAGQGCCRDRVRCTTAA